MPAESDSFVAELRDALLRRVNQDGGWGYYQGQPSRLEPTCWALRGLRSAGALDAEAIAASAELFGHWQRADGLFLDAGVGGQQRPNLAFNGLAAWLLLQVPELARHASVTGLVDALTCAKGIMLPESTINRQDDALQGWSWIDGTFSWVEPTCWGLLALKTASRMFPVVEARVEEGERLLIDRCCPAGGWNYGNANMLGQSLHAYVPTTALGLLAMKERRSDPCVERSLAFLKQHRLAEPSAMALGLTAVALRTFGEAATDVQDLLRAQWSRTAYLDNAHLIGLALYALV